MKLLAAILVVIGLTIALFAVSAAQAVTVIVCYEYQSLIDVAKSQQGEVPIGTGRGPAGTLTMLLDPKDMSWGIITRANNGCSIYFGGTDFQLAAPSPKPGKDS